MLNNTNTAINKLQSEGKILWLARLGWGVALLLAIWVIFGNLLIWIVNDIFWESKEYIGFGPIQSFRINVTLFSIQYFVSLVYFVSGLILFWKKPSSLIVLVISMVFLSYGTTEIIDLGKIESPRYSTNFWIVNSLQAFGEWLSLVVFFVFPDGKFKPNWTRGFSLIYAVMVMVWLVYPEIPLNVVHGFTYNETPILSTLFATLIHSTSLYALYYRYRNSTDTTIRRQMKWVVYGLTIAFVSTVIRYLLLAIFGRTGLIEFATDQMNWIFQWNVQNIQRILLISVPITFAIAILQDNLWDIDFLINRTVLYVSLSSIVIVVYITIVGSLSVLFHAFANDFLISLIGAGFIAVLFAPLRDFLNRQINRFLYGDRDTPYVVVSNLAKQLGASLEPKIAFSKTVQTIGDSLKLPYVGISLNGDMKTTEIHFHPANFVAEYGVQTTSYFSFPLVYQGEELGFLLASPREGQESFLEIEKQLLTDLAIQAGLMAHNYQLMQDLLIARRKLVKTREEEKKRIRRELHDGLGPQLALLKLTLTTIRNRSVEIREDANELIEDAISQTESSIHEVRALINELRPPDLDELGLIAAIEKHLKKASDSEVHFDFKYSKLIPAFSAAIEIALWRIVQEGINNVVRHSQASHCRLELVVDQNIHLSICDDGCGLHNKNSLSNKVGVGLESMRERTEELEGVFSIETPIGGGTCLHIQLPITN